ncbi:Crp/Fnr family transcriptional regulator [Photobacterium piscicola]|uniref:Crp/Fnr family transcriptional regulator n=1 Tax=Photobacterium piscicola TaxID=1378299 RepID=UPI002E19AC67|nr:Crp/Fnr family transcriptional regulator [Photobacterium piscicola]
MSFSIISLMSKTQLASLALLQEKRSYQAGTILFHQGREANRMYVIEKGKVTLYRLMTSGEEKVFNIFLAGDVIAEMAMFMSPRQYPMTARVEQDSVLLVYKHTDIKKIVSQTPELAVRVMEYMTNKIHCLVNDVNILTQVNANQRFVMKLAEIYKKQSSKDNKISLSITKKLLATQLGMTPETLSRTIKRLKNEGLLIEHGNSLQIKDIVALCQSVNLTADIFYH